MASVTTESWLPPATMLTSKAYAPTGAVPIKESYTATQDHGDVQPRLLLGALSESVALFQLGSELTPMSPIATEGCAEAHSFG